MNQEEWVRQRDDIAANLRQLRLGAGLTGGQLAERHGWTQSKVSKIESAKQLPTGEDIRLWVSSCGAVPAAGEQLLEALRELQAGHRDWKRRMRRGQAAVQADYNQLVAEAAVVCHFETVYVPGLLQTAEYARHILLDGAEVAEVQQGARDVDAAVATRMERQRVLYDPGKSFEFLLAEPVLRWLICPPLVMRSQLDRLQTVIGLANVQFGILPMGRRLSIVPQNSFQLYDSVALVETIIGEWRHTVEDSATYRRALDLMWNDAVTGIEAREMLAAAVVDLRE